MGFNVNDRAVLKGRLSTADQVEAIGRRRFIGQLSLSTMSAALGSTIVFGAYLPAGMVPVALAEPNQASSLPGKDPRLTLLNDRPINAETPAHLLDPDLTPAERLFIRNNGHPPNGSPPRPGRFASTENQRPGLPHSISTCLKVVFHSTLKHLCSSVPAMAVANFSCCKGQSMVGRCGGLHRLDRCPIARRSAACWRTGVSGICRVRGRRYPSQSRPKKETHLPRHPHRQSP